MLSNVTKSADVLRGATEMQDLWAEIEKEYPVANLKGPRQLQGHIMVGKINNEKEARDEAERVAHTRQQRNNFYQSDSAKKLKQRKSDMAPSERKQIMSRLTNRPAHKQARPKSPTGTGHFCEDGVLSPGRRDSPPLAKSKSSDRMALVSSPGTEVRSERMRGRSKFEGLTLQDFYSNEWRPSFTYRPAKQDAPWKEVEGFSKSTRTLEQRKMNPFLDINSYQGNRVSAKQTFSHGHVRPLDVKGNLGARPIQQWKATLREDFARDDDNFSSNAHDAQLAKLREAMANDDVRDFATDID